MKKLLFSVIIHALLTNCTGLTVRSSLDKEVNFSEYKKYAWVPQRHVYDFTNTPFNSDSVQSKIQSAVMEELRLRGLTLDTANPDILIDYDLMLKKSLKPDSLVTFGAAPVYYRKFPRYSEYNYSRNSFYYGRWNQYYADSYISIINKKPIKVTYDEGTIIVDIVDIKANKLVWKGWIEEEVVNPAVFNLELTTDISEMFKSYPVPALK